MCGQPLVLVAYFATRAQEKAEFVTPCSASDTTEVIRSLPTITGQFCPCWYESRQNGLSHRKRTRSVGSTQKDSHSSTNITRKNSLQQS